MPHSYGASFSGVGFLGATRCESTMLNAPNPAPSPIMIRIGTQPCMRSGTTACEFFLKRAAKKRVGHQPDAASKGSLHDHHPNHRMLSRTSVTYGSIAPVELSDGPARMVQPDAP